MTHPVPIIRLSEIAPLLFTAIALVIMLIPSIDHGEIIGMWASTLAFAVFVPQALRVWTARNDHHALLGVSITTNIFVINNALVWWLYAYSIQEFWVGAAGLINLPLALMIIIVIIRSRLIRRRQGHQEHTSRTLWSYPRTASPQSPRLCNELTAPHHHHLNPETRSCAD